MMYEVWTEGTIWHADTIEEANEMCAEFDEREVPYALVALSNNPNYEPNVACFVRGDFSVFDSSEEAA